MSDERRGPEPISKATGAYMSIGAILALVTVGTVAGVKWNTAQADATALAVTVEDNAGRQQTYIERRNSQHDETQEQLDELERRVEDLQLWIASNHGEDPTR